jgi:ribosomal protein S18 acetylase RimI-like enzyme
VIALVPVAEADVAELARDYAALRAAARDPRRDPPSALEATLRRRLAEGFEALWIEADGARAGYALWRAEPGEGCVFLRHLYLRSGFRGRGLGRAAVAALRARWGADAPVMLDVASGNPEAAAFWRAMGFEVVAHRLMAPAPAEGGAC